MDDVYESAELAPTQVKRDILGRYRLGNAIGAGSMANVYDAVDVWTGERVALKSLRPQCAESSELVARFLREGRALQRIQHANIVRVIDHGVAADGVAWIAMERLSGMSLERLLDLGPLSPERALRLMLGVAKALATVHARGMVHRDVKPENIVVVDPGTPHEEAKLIDFGIAHVAREDLGDDSVQYTTTKSILGSMAFMAPEQLAGGGGAATAQSDVFSFAVTLYEAMTRQSPFRGAGMAEQVRARTKGSIVPVSERIGAHRSAGPLDALMKRCLSPDPAKRPPNGLALIKELRAVLDASPSPPVGAKPVETAVAGVLGLLFGGAATVATVFALHAAHLF